MHHHCAPPAPPAPDIPCLRVDLADGALILTLDAFDEPTVEAIKALPHRRYDPQTTHWTAPATRETLTAVAQLIRRRTLDGAPHQMTDAAQARIEHCTPAQITVTDDTIHISGPYNRTRVQTLRDIADTTYNPDTHEWTAPTTRGAALALLETLTSWRFAADPEHHQRLERLAQATPPPDHHDGPTDRETRRGPVAHWKHYTRGPIFQAHPERHEWIDGVGWCVRIRAGTPRTPDP